MSGMIKVTLSMPRSNSNPYIDPKDVSTVSQKVHAHFALNFTLRPLDQNYSSNDEYDMLLEDNLLHTRQYSLYGNSQATAAS